MESLAPEVNESVALVLRWAHFIAGVMWIGSSIFFHWLDSHLEPPGADGGRSGKVEGVLWMVHSGGFYEVEKKLVAPDALPKTLHWFKWEAGFTWLTGFFLLVLLYHVGDAALLLDPQTARVSPAIATGICFVTLVVAWLAYDALWSSRLAGRADENPALAVLLSCLGLAAVAFGLSALLSGRAAYIHVGAVMGTCMVANVWQRIIPAQRNLVESVRGGTSRDAAMAHAAKRRSKHNHYMTYPVLFIMISNHFPQTYGAAWNWAVLLGIMAVGAGVKLWMNVKHPPPAVMLGALGVGLALVAGASAVDRLARPSAEDASPRAEGRPIEATGRIVGVVRLTGALPPPRTVTLYGGCEEGHDGPVSIPAGRVAPDGGLAEAFVAIASGVEGYAYPRRREEVLVDQRRCLYAPRVVGAQVGQPVVFLNSDPLFHNVRSVSTANPTWNVGMPAQGQRDTKVFRVPEVMVETRCDVHPWMLAWVGVKAHPWFTVTGDDGRFVLEGVPAGRVELEVWHPATGRRIEVVEVPAGGDVDVELVVSPPEPTP